mgnify:CR=1 FL=1
MRTPVRRDDNGGSRPRLRFGKVLIAIATIEVGRPGAQRQGANRREAVIQLTRKPKRTFSI